MHISIIGNKGSGKTTLFRALGEIKADTRQLSEATKVIDVPDERLNRLSLMFKPKKTVYAKIMVSDTSPIKLGQADEKEEVTVINQLRESDAFILVLRNFQNGYPRDPKSEFLKIYEEFMLSDIIQIENRLERLKRQKAKKGNQTLLHEEETLKACLEHLNQNQPLSNFTSLNQSEKLLKGFGFLSQKPMIVVGNCQEEDLISPEEIMANLREAVPAHIPIIVASAVLEKEFAALSPSEQKELLAGYNLTEQIASKIIRLAYEILGLISFFTVGEDECRAWSIPKGITAQEAAGVIHTDLSKRFIRAEVVSYNDFMTLGGFPACKKAGLWRLEGKNYIVQDGDILSIRAGN